MEIASDIENKILRDFLGDSDAIKYLRTNTLMYRKITKYDGKGKYDYYYSRGFFDNISNTINRNMINFNLKKIVLWRFQSTSDITFINKMYPNIECLQIHFSPYNHDNNSHIIIFKTLGLFQKLKDVTIYDNFSGEIGFLPENLEKLSMMTNYNKPIKLPPKLQELYLGDMFNQELELPETLKVLQLGYDYNQQLKLPSDLYQLYPGELFQHKIEYYPDSLKRLTISENYEYPIPSDFKPISNRNYARYDCLCELNEHCYKESIQFFKDYMTLEYQECQSLKEWIYLETANGSYDDLDIVNVLVNMIGDESHRTKISEIITEIAQHARSMEDNYFGFGEELSDSEESNDDFYPFEDFEDFEEY